MKFLFILLLAQLAFSTSGRPHENVLRLLDVDQCFGDLQDAFIANNTQLNETYVAYEDEFNALEDRCAPLRCVIDEATISEQQPFIAACTEAGGVLVEYDYVEECIDTSRLVPNYRRGYENFVTCYPPSCMAADVKDHYVNEFEGANPALHNYEIFDVLPSDRNQSALICGYTFTMRDPSSGEVFFSFDESPTREESSGSSLSLGLMILAILGSIYFY